jgi:hypothetical protein
VRSSPAREIEAALLEMPHLVPVDAIGISEIASVLATLEAIDKALADGRVENKRGQVRALLATKATLSRQLREWLREFGGTPRARFEFARSLSTPTLGEEIARRVAEIDAREANGAGDQ